MVFFDQFKTFKMPTIKFEKIFAVFMIPIALLKELEPRQTSHGIVGYPASDVGKKV